MPHVELALTDDLRRLAPADPPGPRAPRTSFERWAAATAAAAEPALVLNAQARIIAVSASCAEMIGLGDPATVRGRPLREAVPHLLDFANSPGQLDSAEADKIPPLLAISSGRLARGLLRVAEPATGTARTMDAIATPLWDEAELAGSLTFFSQI